MVDFEWYRSFIAIYKHSSVSEAARTRIMTQPAMSQHLASLEARVGEQLFFRTSRKLVPTERGKQLYAHVAPHIEALDERTMELKHNLSPLRNTIRIGTTPELFAEIVMASLSQMEWNIVSYFGDTEQLLELLKEERVDVILTPRKFVTPGIEYVRLMQESFVVVAPYETVVPEFTHLKDMESWLSEQRWISYGLELPIIRRYWKEMFKKGPLINPTHVIPSMPLILKAIEEGVGISLLPVHMLKDQETTKPRWKLVFEHMTIHNDLLIGIKSKQKHVLVINDFIKCLCEHHKNHSNDSKELVGIGATNEYARLIIDSYERLTGRMLLDEKAMPGNEFNQLYHAPVVVLSHGPEADPILNYSNLAAQELWEMDWSAFMGTPSRWTTEALDREERDGLFRAVDEHGYVDNYTGIRISSTGRRFYVEQATVWNLIDERGVKHGQAAAFREYRYI
ncbi:DNA-binding transcriptional regulator, LysR family [Paenibacillus sp. CF384]|nr:MEKHLA domain-containing protein [Paenibacillus sp. CF384]SDX89714.1 DNA-binding transcriptional regulator, LysR family [Paenibacillus sp. CF384]